MSDISILNNNKTLLSDDLFNTKAKAYANILIKNNIFDEINFQKLADEIIKPFGFKVPKIIISGSVTFKDTGARRHAKYNKISSSIIIPAHTVTNGAFNIRLSVIQMVNCLLQSVDIKHFKFSHCRCRGFILREQQMMEFLGLRKKKKE